MMASGLSAEAVAAHPSESRTDGELSVCSTENSCCTKQSEEVIILLNVPNKYYNI